MSLHPSSRLGHAWYRAVQLMLALVLFAGLGTAHAWPTKPVRFVVSFPPGTPAEVVERLNREINRQLELPATRARFSDLGAEPLPGSPAAFKSAAQSESVRFAALVKARQLKAD